MISTIGIRLVLVCTLSALCTGCMSTSDGRSKWLDSRNAAADADCDRKSFGDSSIVCKCNSTFCDTFPDIGTIPSGYYTIYSSSQDGDRFNKQAIPFSNQSALSANGKIVVNLSAKYQSIIGFGGAVTDAASMNVLSLSPKSQRRLIESYFSTEGIEYTLIRVPIASTDFSTHAYSYDDVEEDIELTHFALADEDIHYKIPLVKSAVEMSKRKINLFASAWSAPSWMKTSSSMIGRGYLKGNPGGKYYKAWANYLIKFLNEYSYQGLDFWGMTAQNEPLDGRIPGFSFQCMGFTAEMQQDFIALDLGPALQAGGYGGLKLMIFDDSTLLLPSWAETIYGNEPASQYISGLAVHWYMNGILPYSRINQTHYVNPKKFILSTEACAGSYPLQKKVRLGSWERAEQYADDIIQDLQNWVTGWTDWNIALNMSGGPNWVNNNVDSPIIVNAELDEFYKQPMYYAMGHFSKFLTPGSVRHDMDITGASISGIVFSTPEKYIVMVLLNKESEEIVADVAQDGRAFSVSMKAKSISTVVWNQ